MLSILSIINSVDYSASLETVLPFQICPFTYFTPNLRVTSQKAESLCTYICVIMLTDIVMEMHSENKNQVGQQ